MVENRMIWIQGSERILKYHLHIMTVFVQILTMRRDRLAVQRDASRSRRLQTCNHSGDCRFTGTRLTNKSNGLIRS